MEDYKEENLKQKINGWTISGMDQVMVRAVRHESHENLKDSKRNVTIYHLMTLKPKDFENFGDLSVLFKEATDVDLPKDDELKPMSVKKITVKDH